MEILRNAIKNYAWGSRTALSELCGRPAAEQPEAELWIGAHAGGPSRVLRGGREWGLDELISADPTAALGVECRRAFGDRLPFLLKVLAAARPLSIQVHPDLSRAQQGFERETAQGLALDDPGRSYRDPNHKPELICALGEFHALCGFRPLAATAALLRELAVPQLSSLGERLQREEASALAGIVDGFFHAPAAARATTIAALAAGLARLEPDGAFSAEARWLPQLAREFPDDPGVLTALLMNHVSLRPGEAIYLRPRTLHAYLFGTGVEMMASSDNVVRGGLTGKHVDVEELLSLTDFEPAPAVSISAHGDDTGEQLYPVPARELRLSRATLAEGEHWSCARCGPDVLLCVAGSARASARSGELRLTAGDSVFVPFDDGPCELSGGPATLFRATVAI